MIGLYSYERNYDNFKRSLMAIKFGDVDPLTVKNGKIEKSKH